jgi:energy-coupling factor transport system substrate-specific component
MSKELLSGSYYLVSVGLILLSFVVFFFSYEKRKPHAREIVTLAVMCAIAVASRVIFSVIPNFKPVLGIIMLTGMALGPGAGFLTGAMTAFVSNFIFGQGPWTPWQMAAFGIAGALAGLLCKKGIMTEKKRLLTAVLGYVMIQFMVGPILDVCSIFTMKLDLSGSAALAVFAYGFVPNLIHGLATAVTLFLLVKPMMEKLNRMKVKYGIMTKEADEWEDV